MLYPKPADQCSTTSHDEPASVRFLAVLGVAHLAGTPLAFSISAASLNIRDSLNARA
jgi:hypothetical protein